MKHRLAAMAAAFAATLAAQTVAAREIVAYTTADSYEDVSFAVENAIIDAGLVVDHVSHVGEMLERTRQDVGGKRRIFLRADVFQFCSARLSRAVMEIDPMNIAYCPYGIFVAERADKPGEVIVGFRGYPDGPMQQVQHLLERIVKDALGE